MLNYPSSRFDPIPSSKLTSPRSSGDHRDALNLVGYPVRL
jgi:hypothetical protein